MRDAASGIVRREVIESAKKIEILPACQAGIEAEVVAGMKTELAANLARILGHIVAGDFRRAASGKQKSRQNAQKRGFARAVGAEQSNGFSGGGFQGNAGKSGNRGLFERLEEGSPAAARGREGLFKGAHENGGFGHREVIACLERRDNRSGRGGGNGGQPVFPPIE